MVLVFSFWCLLLSSSSELIVGFTYVLSILYITEKVYRIIVIKVEKIGGQPKSKKTEVKLMKDNKRCNGTA